MLGWTPVGVLGPASDVAPSGLVLVICVVLNYEAELGMRRLFGILVVVGCLVAVLGLSGSGSGPAVASAAAPAQRIGMRILLITDGTDTNFADATCVANPGICNAGIAYQDWENTLQREGVP